MTTRPRTIAFPSFATVVSLLLLCMFSMWSVHAGNSNNLSAETAETIMQQQDTLSPGAWTSHYAVNPLSMQTNSILTLTEEDFNPGNHINVWNLILGRVPGLNISHYDGEPGGGTSARSNYTSSTPEWPLIVIDGVPLIREFPDGMRNPLNFLSPDDIETVSYLRPTAASAVYGMRGSNGVLIISTRKPDKNAPVRFSYSGNVSLSSVTKTPEVLSTEAFTQLVNERYGDQPDVLSLMGNANTQWQDEIYRNAAGHNHHLAASGNLAKVPWRASLNYTDQAGVLNTDKLQRLGTQLSFHPSLLDDHLQVSLNLHASQLENRLAPQQAISNAIGFDPTQSVYDPGNPFGGYFAHTYKVIPIPTAPANPVALLFQTDNTDQTTTLSARTQINYRLRSLPGLSLHLMASQQQFNSDYKGLTSENAAWEWAIGGRKTENQKEYHSGIMEAWARYQTGVFSGGHSLEASMGVTSHNTRYEYSFYTTNHENNALGIPVQVFEDSHGWSETHFRSLFAHAGYNFSDRYLLYLNLRNDATSRLADDNNSSLYYGVSAAWQVHNEVFWPENAFFSALQPRLSYGTHGMLPVFSSIANTFFPNTPYGLDMNLKPEKRTTLNGGIDIALLNNRINLSADYHQTSHTDIILPMIVPSGTNLTSIVLTNIGEAESSGWDISLHALPVLTENLSWSITTHFQSSSNEIIKMSQVADDSFSGILFGSIQGGGAYNTIFIDSDGFPFSSFFVLQSIYNNEGYPQPNLYVDQNQDGIITEDDYIRYQTPYPDFTMGIASQLQWNNWNVGFSGRFQSGNYVYNNTSSFFGNYSRLYRPEGPYLGNITPEALALNFENPHLNSDYYVQDATFFRMDFISLGYRFGGLLQDALNLTLTATVQNAFVLTNYEGMDPEVPSGIDFARYPRPRTFVLGVKMDF